jgi:serine/threonine-protein kinase RIO1
MIVFRQLIEAYSILYRNKMTHADLKMENILLHQGKVKIAGTVFSSIIENVDFANVRIYNILSIYGSP